MEVAIPRASPLSVIEQHYPTMGQALPAVDNIGDDTADLFHAAMACAVGADNGGAHSK